MSHPGTGVSRAVIACALPLAAILGGCARAAGDPPPATADRYRGTVEATCSPVDAAAIGLDLQPERGEQLPRIGITLWPRRGPVAGQRIELSMEGEGYAAALMGGTEWTQATGGVLMLESYAGGGPASGWFTLELSDGGRLSGWFEADWLDRGPVGCG